MSVIERDRDFMARALELARAPASTSPNPRVGAVVVRDGQIIGEGTHEGAGTPHAEALALGGIDARGGTLYVNLEPCTHQGRTPPCAPAIIEAGIQRVVAATADPDEQVSGKGFVAVSEAGIDLELGVLEDEAELVNAPYLHHRRTGDSFVTLKLAQSLDGGIAAPDGSARWITGEEARKRVHARRREADAVMVGAGTVLADDPELTARDVPAVRHQPLRLIVDGSGRVPTSARVFTGKTGAVLVATTDRSSEEARAAWASAGAEVLVLPQTERGVDLNALVKELGTRDLVEIFCEGGAELATSLLEAGLVGRLELHYGPVLLGADAVRIHDLGVASMQDAQRWRLERVERAGDDFIVALRPSKASD